MGILPCVHAWIRVISSFALPLLLAVQSLALGLGYPKCPCIEWMDELKKREIPCLERVSQLFPDH